MAAKDRPTARSKKVKNQSLTRLSSDSATKSLCFYNKYPSRLDLTSFVVVVASFPTDYLDRKATIDFNLQTFRDGMINLT